MTKTFYVINDDFAREKLVSYGPSPDYWEWDEDENIDVFGHSVIKKSARFSSKEEAEAAKSIIEKKFSETVPWTEIVFSVVEIKQR